MSSVILYFISPLRASGFKVELLCNASECPWLISTSSPQFYQGKFPKHCLEPLT